MTLRLRDGVAALLMTAVMAPYVVFFVRGRAPHVDDVRMMTGIALGLGLAAVVVAGRFSWATVVARAELVLTAVLVVVGVVTVTLADRPAGRLLLGGFITVLLATWGVQLLHHAGVISDRPINRSGRR